MSSIPSSSVSSTASPVSSSVSSIASPVSSSVSSVMSSKRKPLGGDVKFPCLGHGSSAATSAYKSILIWF